MRDIRKSEQWSDVVSAFLWFIIITALLAMTVMGARCYRTAVHEKEENDHVRETLSYLQSRADGSEGVTLKQGTEGDMLCFAEAGGAYETRVYVSGGMLLEELAEIDAPLAPERGQSICSVHSFTVESAAGGTVRITVDGKCAYVGKGG